MTLALVQDKAEVFLKDPARQYVHHQVLPRSPPLHIIHRLKPDPFLLLEIILLDRRDLLVIPLCPPLQKNLLITNTPLLTAEDPTHASGILLTPIVVPRPTIIPPLRIYMIAKPNLAIEFHTKNAHKQPNHPLIYPDPAVIPTKKHKPADLRAMQRFDRVLTACRSIAKRPELLPMCLLVPIGMIPVPPPR